MSATDDTLEWRVAQARATAADDFRLRYTRAPGIACGAILHSRPGSKQAPYVMAGGMPQGLSRPQTARLPARNGQALAPTTLDMWGKDTTRGFAYGVTAAPFPCTAPVGSSSKGATATAAAMPGPAPAFRPTSALVKSLSSRSPAFPSASQQLASSLSPTPMAGSQRPGRDLGVQQRSGMDQMSSAAPGSSTSFVGTGAPMTSSSGAVAAPRAASVAAGPSVTATGTGSGAGAAAGEAAAGLAPGASYATQAGRTSDGKTPPLKARASSMPRGRVMTPAPAPAPSPRTPASTSLSHMQRLITTLDVPMPLQYQSRVAVAAAAATPLLTVQRIGGQSGAGGGGGKALGGRGQPSGSGVGLPDWLGGVSSELDRQRSSPPPGRWSYSGNRASTGDAILRPAPPPAGALAGRTADMPQAVTRGAQRQDETSLGAGGQGPVPEQEDQFSAGGLADRGPWVRPTSASSSPRMRRPTSSPLPATAPVSPPLQLLAPAPPASPCMPPYPGTRNTPPLPPALPRGPWSQAAKPRGEGNSHSSSTLSPGLEPWMLEASTGWSIPGAPLAPLHASQTPYPSSTPSPIQSAPRQATWEAGRDVVVGAGWQAADGAAAAPRPCPSPGPSDVAAAVAAAAQRVRERIARPDSQPPTVTALPRNRNGTALEGSVQLLQSLEHWRTPVFVARGAIRPPRELRQELAALDAMPMIGWSDPLEEDGFLACKAEAGSRRQAAEAAARAASAAEVAGDAGVGGYWRGREQELLQEAAALDAGILPRKGSQDGSRGVTGEASACSYGGGGKLQASRSTPSTQTKADAPGKQAARKVGSAAVGQRVRGLGGRQVGGGVARKAGRAMVEAAAEEESSSDEEEEEEEEEEEDTSSSSGDE